ncbi:hypothetical protein HDU82_001098 [Entophlyctis luteolus]|nr:hypothetical protein HDU82_001098 [Entophlyctis luteolus]
MREAEISAKFFVGPKGYLPCSANCDSMKNEENRTVEYSIDMVEFAENNFEFAQKVCSIFQGLLDERLKFYKFPTEREEYLRFITDLAAFFDFSTEVDDFGEIAVRKLQTSESPRISILTAVDLKKKGLLLFAQPTDPDQHHKLRRQRIPKGFAKAIPVPQIEQLSLSNSFEALSLE